jgi:hypothetical protein
VKKVELFSIPFILMVNLKRFNSKSDVRSKDKLEDEVHMPNERPDLPDIVLSNKEANVNVKRKGSSHCTQCRIITEVTWDLATTQPLSKPHLDIAWLDFGDSYVTEICNLNKVITGAVYSLSYKRKGFNLADEPGFGTMKTLALLNIQSEVANGNVKIAKDLKLEAAHYAVLEPTKEETLKNDEDIGNFKS